MKDLVDLRKATLELTDHTILTIRYKDGSIVELADAVELDQMQYNMAAGNEVCILVDILGIDNRVTKEAQDYFMRRGKMLPLTKAVAVLQQEDQANLETSLRSVLQKPIYPLRTFENKEEAITWLKRKFESIS